MMTVILLVFCFRGEVLERSECRAVSLACPLGRQQNCLCVLEMVERCNNRLRKPHRWRVADYVSLEF